ncbi:hypothetical protein [Flavobacterium sp.]|uniref:hypothetical protein n=1 Tax=Flavobacterium sp. TaxID=239 RepID=UPI0037524122
MKTFIKKISILLVLTMILSCSKDDAPAASNSTVADLGTFAGNLQVSDDPQTDLGYVYNTNVTVTTSGTNATMKITGNEGFDREYTGTISAGSTASSTIITINKQTKPVDKIAGSTVLVINNELSIDINLANDRVTVRKTPTSPTTVDIVGKIRMIGTNLLKK